MKKSNVGQPISDPSDDVPPADPSTGQDGTILSSSPFHSPPSEILELIFRAVPAEERVKVGRVCKYWRNVLLKTSSCWRDIHWGRNANCLSSTPPSDHESGVFPLQYVEEVEDEAICSFLAKLLTLNREDRFKQTRSF